MQLPSIGRLAPPLPRSLRTCDTGQQEARSTRDRASHDRAQTVRKSTPVRPGSIGEPVRTPQDAAERGSNPLSHTSNRDPACSDSFRDTLTAWQLHESSGGSRSSVRTIRTIIGCSALHSAARTLDLSVGRGQSRSGAKGIAGANYAYLMALLLDVVVLRGYATNSDQARSVIEASVY